MLRILLLFLVVIPFIQARKLLHGYPLYDYSRYHCLPADGGWTEWSYFGPCSVSCGKGGYQKRYRYCAAPYPKYGGKNCEGHRFEARECHGKFKCPIDGGWSKEVKGECSESCGGGYVEFTKECNNPRPRHCGKDCVGPDVRTESCNTHACPVWGNWTCSNCTKDKITKKCEQNCTRECKYHKIDKNYCDDSNGGSFEKRGCDNKKCRKEVDGDNCESCREKADRRANDPKYPSNFVGFACRATNLASLCRKKKHQNDLSKNGGYPANHWFWIHCSPDGPWCKPCATRNLVFNKKCDACEATRDGPCTGTHLSDVYREDPLLDEDDLW